MTITTGTHPKLLWPGLQAIWGNMYKDQPEGFSKVFEVGTSDKAYEEDQEMAGFGLAVAKSEGSSISYDTSINGYVTRYTHVTYGLGFIVTEEAVEDNQYKAQAEKRVKALRRSMRHTPIPWRTPQRTPRGTGVCAHGGACAASRSPPSTSRIWISRRKSRSSASWMAHRSTSCRGGRETCAAAL